MKNKKSLRCFHKLLKGNNQQPLISAIALTPCVEFGFPLLSRRSFAKPDAEFEKARQSAASRRGTPFSNRIFIPTCTRSMASGSCAHSALPIDIKKDAMMTRWMLCLRRAMPAASLRPDAIRDRGRRGNPRNQPPMDTNKR
ncbi:MAG: hypothetical protein ABIJ53_09980 [Verrucomicrobiota bacterium]